MPLVAALKSAPLLQPFLKASCAEHGMAAMVSPTIAPADIVIISPDDYFNSSIGHERHAEEDGQPPKSPDCLVVVRCHDGTFSVFIIELRDIKNRKGFRTRDIEAKFKTCLQDFMQDVLGSHFNNINYSLNRVKLFFVSDPYNERASSESRHDYNRGLKLDVFLGMRPFYFDGHRLGIEHHAHNPLIRPC